MRIRIKVKAVTGVQKVKQWSTQCVHALRSVPPSMHRGFVQNLSKLKGNLNDYLLKIYSELRGTTSLTA